MSTSAPGGGGGGGPPRDVRRTSRSARVAATPPATHAAGGRRRTSRLPSRDVAAGDLPVGEAAESGVVRRPCRTRRREPPPRRRRRPHAAPRFGIRRRAPPSSSSAPSKAHAAPRPHRNRTAARRGASPERRGGAATAGRRRRQSAVVHARAPRPRTPSYRRAWSWLCGRLLASSGRRWSLVPRDPLKTRDAMDININQAEVLPRSGIPIAAGLENLIAGTAARRDARDRARRGAPPVRAGERQRVPDDSRTCAVVHAVAVRAPGEQIRGRGAASCRTAPSIGRAKMCATS